MVFHTTDTSMDKSDTTVTNVVHIHTHTHTHLNSMLMITPDDTPRVFHTTDTSMDTSNT
jgi:hypothetical protein